MHNYFLTGHRGFLGSALAEKLTNTQLYTGDVRSADRVNTYSGMSHVIHFASPSDDYDFKDVDKTVTTIINGTINMVNLARKNNAKLIFASTLGVCELSHDNSYTCCKAAMEQYIISANIDYVILRIPRVYDKTRIKGLMKKIRLGHVRSTDLNNTVEYLTLQSFIDQTISVINMSRLIYHYDKLYTDTISNIRDMMT